MLTNLPSPATLKFAILTELGKRIDEGGSIMALKPTDIIGKAIVIKGELQGEEDLIIEGRVEGIIALKKHLIIEKTGVIHADVQMESITVKGEVNGNIVATNRVEITADAKVTSDIKSPRVVIEDGAKFKGAIEMDVKLPDNL